MSFLLPLVAGCVLLPGAEPDRADSLRYLRPEKDKYVAAGTVSTTRADDATVVTIRSEQADGKATLTLTYDGAGKLTGVDVVQDRENRRKSANLTLGEKGTGVMKRGGITDLLKDLPANPVVAASPAWTDVLQLVRRYDRARGGKQEFRGVWIDPVEGLLTQKFSAERQSAVTVTVKDKEQKIDRYRLKLRDGDYTAWADADGRVVRVQATAAKAVPVVLEGFEEATRGLKP